MPTMQVQVRRFSVVSAGPFEDPGADLGPSGRSVHGTPRSSPRRARWRSSSRPGAAGSSAPRCKFGPFTFRYHTRYRLDPERHLITWRLDTSRDNDVFDDNWGWWQLVADAGERSSPTPTARWHRAGSPSPGFSSGAASSRRWPPSATWPCVAGGPAPPADPPRGEGAPPARRPGQSHITSKSAPPSVGKT
jgi:hypothetical protein